MKASIIILLLCISAYTFGQKDTVMLNKTFVPDPNQKYELSSIQAASKDMKLVLAASVFTAGMFIGSAICLNNANNSVQPAYIAKCERGAKTFQMFGYVSIGVSVVFSIGAIFDLGMPTTIKPVKSFL